MRIYAGKAVLGIVLAATFVFSGLAGRTMAAEPPVTVTRMVPAQPSQVAPDEVSVLVFFDFNRASKELFGRLSGWAKNVGGLVVLDREVIMAPGPAPFARAFVVARTLGVTNSVLPALFELESRRQKQQALGGTAVPIKPAIADIFKAVGINAIEFNAAWNSQASEEGLRRARAMAERFRIHGAPVVVVNGLWKLVPIAAASANDMIDALNRSMNRVVIRTSAGR